MKAYFKYLCIICALILKYLLVSSHNFIKSLHKPKPLKMAGRLRSESIQEDFVIKYRVDVASWSRIKKSILSFINFDNNHLIKENRSKR